MYENPNMNTGMGKRIGMNYVDNGRFLVWYAGFQVA